VFGYDLDGDDVVNGVDDGSPAFRAGVQVGDKIDLRSTPPRFRYLATYGGVLQRGQSIRFGLIHKGARRMVTIKSIANAGDEDGSSAAYRLAVFIEGVIFVFLGAALVLRKPGPATWGFFFFCLGSYPYEYSVALTFFPFPWPLVVNNFLGNFISNAGGFGLIIFALCFLNEPVRGWRQFAVHVTLWVFAAWIVFGVFVLYQWHWIGGPPGVLLTNVIFAIGWGVLSVPPLAAFVATFVRAPEELRQRLRWVLFGFGFYLVVSFLIQALLDYGTNTPEWLLRVLNLSLVVTPLIFAYAVIKHRVIDVTFVVSRAIVLTILTSFVVIIFALIDWIFVRKLEQTGLGIAAGLITVTTLGFTAHALHRRVDTFVDRTFFRRRHLAEERLTRLARELPDVKSSQALSTILVNEPLQAFGLASAALFRRRDGTRFEREDAIGWPSQSLCELDLHIAPLSNVADVRETKRIRWQDPNHVEFPSPDAHPVLTMPIVVGHNLQAIAFYGPHDTGADFDPDEIRAINGMMVPAAAAYHHLEAEALRREGERMRLEAERVMNRWGEAADEIIEPEINPS